MNNFLRQAVAALGDGGLTENGLSQHIFPLFSQVLSSEEIYLRNHSLGRPLDQTERDVQEALSLWRNTPARAWDTWLSERDSYRASLAQLIQALRPDCIIPKTSASEGLRTVLNALPGMSRVVSTRGEFDSVSVVLQRYADLGRITLQWVEPESDGSFETEAISAAIDWGTALIVVSHVMFQTGEVISGMERIAQRCHRVGALLLVDAYHSVGVLPVSVEDLRCDFMIGGCYKYLRGGPGAAFLYVSPQVIDAGFATTDVGWFALDPVSQDNIIGVSPFAAGGNAYLDGTPPVLTYYQARSGLEFTQAIGEKRLRAYSLQQLRSLRQYLVAEGIDAAGGDERHGAFLTVRLPNAAELVKRLAAQSIIVDARGGYVRLCPDCLATDEELRRTAKRFAGVMRTPML